MIPNKRRFIGSFSLYTFESTFRRIFPSLSGFKGSMKEAYKNCSSCLLHQKYSIEDGNIKNISTTPTNIVKGNKKENWYTFLSLTLDQWKRREDPPKRRFKSIKRKVSNNSTFIENHLFIYPLGLHSLQRFPIFSFYIYKFWRLERINCLCINLHGKNCFG